MFSFNSGVLTCRSTSAGGVLVAEVPAVVVPVTGPVAGDAASTAALELVVGAGLDAAGFIAAIPAVVICESEKPLIKHATAPEQLTRAALAWSRDQTTLTGIAVPVDADAPSVGAAELGERLAGGEGCEELKTHEKESSRQIQ